MKRRVTHSHRSSPDGERAGLEGTWLAAAIDMLQEWDDALAAVHAAHVPETGDAAGRTGGALGALLEKPASAAALDRAVRDAANAHTAAPRAASAPILPGRSVFPHRSHA